MRQPSGNAGSEFREKGRAANRCSSELQRGTAELRRLDVISKSVQRQKSRELASELPGVHCASASNLLCGKNTIHLCIKDDFSQDYPKNYHAIQRVNSLEPSTEIKQVSGLSSSRLAVQAERVHTDTRRFHLSKSRAISSLRSYTPDIQGPSMPLYVWGARCPPRLQGKEPVEWSGVSAADSRGQNSCPGSSTRQS